MPIRHGAGSSPGYISAVRRLDADPPSRSELDHMLLGPHAATSMRTALVVDDERVVRDVMRRFLQRAGWVVLEAETAEQALEVLARSGSQLDLVLCDLNLPGLSGSALCGRITSLRPELASRLVLTSGDPLAAAAELARESLLCPVLSKPFSLADLERVVDDAVLVA